MEEGKFQNEYEEIDLMDYLKMLLKRKGLIFGLCLVAVMAAGIFSFLTPKVYKINTILELGTIGGKIVEDPGEVVGKINSDIYTGQILRKLNISGAGLVRIKATNPADTNLVEIEIEAVDTNKAKNISEELGNLILKDQEDETQKKKEYLEKNIGILENNIGILKNDKERIKNTVGLSEEEKKNLENREKILEQLEPYQQISQQLAGSLFNLLDVKEKLNNKKQEIENLYLENNSLEMQLNTIKGQINSLQEQIDNIKPATIMKTPTISETPIKPRPLLNIVIAAILGLFVGVFVAFSKEWWDKSSSKFKV